MYINITGLPKLKFIIVIVTKKGERFCDLWKKHYFCKLLSLNHIINPQIIKTHIIKPWTNRRTHYGKDSY